VDADGRPPRNAPLGDSRSVTVGHRLPRPLGLIGPWAVLVVRGSGEGVVGHDAGWPARSPNGSTAVLFLSVCCPSRWRGEHCGVLVAETYG